MEIADVIPKAGAIRDLYCDACGTGMDLTFPAFSELISGVQINISNFPHLRCPICKVDYLTDRSRLMIVELHRQATERKSPVVNVNRNKKEVDYKFSDVPFLVDADDYYYFPGLYRPFDIGFLTPLFFNSRVLSKFDTLPNYRVRFASQSYGTIEMEEDYISFGINRQGRVIMWLGDVAGLPESEQFYLRSENVESDHSIASEFYDGQIECKFTDPPAEAIAIKTRSEFAKAFEAEFGVELYHLDEELIGVIASLTPPVVDTEKERKHIFDSLNRIFVESINNAKLEKLLKRLGATATSNGSLKRLQAVIETKDSSGKVADLLKPFFVTYDLRLAYSHLTSASRREELLSTSMTRLGVAADIELPDLYGALLRQLIEATEALRKTVS